MKGQMFSSGICVYFVCPQVEKSDQQTSSRLLVSAVRESDSGNYTCVPVSAPTASVAVHVNNGKSCNITNVRFCLSLTCRINLSPTTHTSASYIR